MGLTLNKFWAIVFVVITLFLLATVSAFEVEEGSGFSAVDDSTELVADYAIDSDLAVNSEIKGFQRLPESPGGVIAIVGSSYDTKTNHRLDATPPGGAVGLASNGIRGPTTS